MRGTMTVSGRATPDDKSACDPNEGYNDVPGSQVTLADDAGKTLALGNLSPLGTSGDGVGDFVSCVYDFSLGRVTLTPTAFYSVEVGRRGKVRYTGEQLADGVQLKLGD